METSSSQEEVGYFDYLYNMDFMDYFNKFDVRTFNGLLSRPVQEYAEENPWGIVMWTVIAGIVMGISAHLAAHISVRFFHKPKPIEPDAEDEEVDRIMNKMGGNFNANTINQLRRTVNNVRTAPGCFEAPEACEIDDTYMPCVIKKDKISFPVESPEQNEDNSESDCSSEDEEKTPLVPGKGGKRVIFSDEVTTHGQGTRLSSENIFGTLGELHGKLKTAELRAQSKQLEKEMTNQQRDEEARMRSEQLESIFKLMMKDQNKFGVNNKADLDEQLKLYSL